MIKRNYNTSGDLYNGTTDTIVDLFSDWLIIEFDSKQIAKNTGFKETLDLSVDYIVTKNYIFVHSLILLLKIVIYMMQIGEKLVLKNGKEQDGVIQLL